MSHCHHLRSVTIFVIHQRHNVCSVALDRCALRASNPCLRQVAARIACDPSISGAQLSGTLGACDDKAIKSEVYHLLKSTQVVENTSCCVLSALWPYSCAGRFPSTQLHGAHDSGEYATTTKHLQLIDTDINHDDCCIVPATFVVGFSFICPRRSAGQPRTTLTVAASAAKQL